VRNQWSGGPRQQEIGGVVPVNHAVEGRVPRQDNQHNSEREKPVYREVEGRFSTS
jgi:hypothetical protein